ncbi:MAG: pentapeptide repeat-containing protein [Leptolyngbya sp. SIO3F4]|nr:pentapeptide repeat-containing protein [Leptolyngbya sp. SIO3F4]
MVESTSVPEASPKLSTFERLQLVQTLNALPPAQFEELLVALNPPNSNIPGETAPQANRSAALFRWVESPIGPGIQELETALGIIIATTSGTAPEFLSFAISGKISNKTVTEVRAIVELLRKKTGDDSIDVAFFKEGSIKIILSGSPEGLEKLKELFESDKLVEIKYKPVESVQYIAANTADARKTRLVQTLRLISKNNLTRNIASALADATNLTSAISLTTTLAHDINFVRNITRELAHDIDLALAIDLNSSITNILINARNLTSSLDHAINLDIAQNIASALDHALNLALGYTHDIERDINLTKAIDRAIDIANAINSGHDEQIDLENADLTKTNLQKIDLRQANLTGVDFTRADLTEAVLTEAVLTRTTLTEADVTGTVFGENEGFTEADKLDLQKRGAIFQDPPNSDIPSLALH